MHSKPKVVLFDIDGTLIRTGAGRRAMTRSVESVAGRADELGGVKFAGMTDRAIARAGLELANYRNDFETAIDSVIAGYLEGLEEELKSAEDYTVLPAALQAIRYFQRLPRSAVGLGTGNVERGAELKLQRARLFDHFSFGGYASDAEDRAELLRIGAQRGADELGASLEDCSIVIIGDTPKDVHAAHAIGAQCLAVATGSYERSALRKAGAKLVFEDLEYMLTFLQDD